MTDEELKLCDRKSGAFHEAGHAVVGLVLGISEVTLIQSPFEPLNATDRFFSGQVHWIDNLKGNGERGVFGLAGWIAERIAENPETDFLHLLDDVDYYVTYEMSDTDRKMIDGLAGSDLEQAVEMSFEILKKHWTAVQGLAYRLVHNEVGRINAERSDLKGPWEGLLTWDSKGPFSNLE